uniref:Uncharacterized protein n=1 Tax=Lepeophtheirus salmonis TaxID=72036 RepID=A0A0K2SXI0_LEPSM
MGALNSIPLCSKSSTGGPVLELDDEDKLPGSDANNNRADTVVTQPISGSVPEATSTPVESHSSIEGNSDNELKDSDGTLQMPTLDRAIIETTHDSGLDDLDDDIEHTIPTPIMTSSEDEDDEEEDDELKEGIKDQEAEDDEQEGEELERPGSPTPLDNESSDDRIVLGKEGGNTDSISNLLDDIITGSDSTSIIQPIR